MNNSALPNNPRGTLRARVACSSRLPYRQFTPQNSSVAEQIPFVVSFITKLRGMPGKSAGAATSRQTAVYVGHGGTDDELIPMLSEVLTYRSTRHETKRCVQ